CATVSTRALGDPGGRRGAGIGCEQSAWRPSIHDSEAVELLEEATAALGEGDSELRALGLSGLARALDLRGGSRRASFVRAQSIAMSRRRADPRTLAATLAMAYW